MKALSTKAEQSCAPAAGQSGRLKVQHLAVDEDHGAGQRVDNFLLRHCKGVPKSHLYQLIRSGQVRINGRRCKADSRLQIGDSVRLPPIDRSLPPQEPVAGKGRRESLGSVPPARFEALFEDSAMLVIDKPAGVAVHGGSGVAHGAIERLRAARPDAKFLELAHRLDRETSGLLMFGKRRTALLALHAQLRERQADKCYLAIVKGRWPLRTKTVRKPLFRYLTPDGERRVRVQQEGQSAISRITGRQHFDLPGLGVFSLVEVAIETGRTHQIRVHLADAGFPIVGDDKYGDFKLNKDLQKAGFARMFLHAWRLKIRHPIDGQELLLEAPRPAEFDNLVRMGLKQDGN